MSAVETMSSAQAVPRSRIDYPVAGLRFDITFFVLACWLTAGLFLDGWAHNHLGDDLDPIFTPWHAVMYTGSIAVLLFLGYHCLRNVSQGYSFKRMLPKGYNVALIGIIIFGIGGVADLTWHAIAGIESGAEIFLSPSHYALVFGIALVMSAPVWAAWFRTEEAENRKRYLMIIVATAIMLATIQFIFQYSVLQVMPVNLFTVDEVDPSLVESKQVARQLDSLKEDLLIAYQVNTAINIMFHSILTMGAFLMLIRRWGAQLPRFTFTLMLTVMSLMLVTQTDLFIFVPGMILTGVVADILRWRLNVSDANRVALHTWAAVVPMTMYLLYFLTCAIFVQQLGWAVRPTVGMIVVAGLAGIFVSYLVFPPISDSQPATV